MSVRWEPQYLLQPLGGRGEVGEQRRPWIKIVMVSGREGEGSEGDEEGACTVLPASHAFKQSRQGLGKSLFPIPNKAMAKVRMQRGGGCVSPSAPEGE